MKSKRIHYGKPRLWLEPTKGRIALSIVILIFIFLPVILALCNRYDVIRIRFMDAVVGFGSGFLFLFGQFLLIFFGALLLNHVWKRNRY